MYSFSNKDISFDKRVCVIFFSSLLGRTFRNKMEGTVIYERGEKIQQRGAKNFRVRERSGSNLYYGT